MLLRTSWWGAISNFKLGGEVHFLHICSHLEHINYCQNWEYNYHVTYADSPSLTSRLPTESTSVTGNKTIQTGSVENAKQMERRRPLSLLFVNPSLSPDRRCCEVVMVCDCTVCGRGAMSTRRHHMVNEQLTINSWLPFRLSSLNSWLIVATLAI